MLCSMNWDAAERKNGWLIWWRRVHRAITEGSICSVGGYCFVNSIDGSVKFQQGFRGCGWVVRPLLSTSASPRGEKGREISTMSTENETRTARRHVKV